MCFGVPNTKLQIISQCFTNLRSEMFITLKMSTLTIIVKVLISLLFFPDKSDTIQSLPVALPSRVVQLLLPLLFL